MSWVLVADGLTLVLVSLGALLFFAGWVGLLRFPDALSRMHALSKADNVGLGLVVIGLLPQASWPFGALKLLALWLVGIVIGGAAGQLLAGAIHAKAIEADPGAAGDGMSTPSRPEAPPAADGGREGAG
jgi:multicomponent Na+:H+ antiporter subunit G